MAGAMTTYSRNLVRYAFVAERFAETGDINRGLAPLFAPICIQRTGLVFDPADFSGAVADIYGIDMSVMAAEGISQMLAAEGLLVLDADAGTAIQYKYADQIQDVEDELSGVLDATLQNFLQHAKTVLAPHFKTIPPDEDLIDAFTRRLLSADFLNIADKESSEYSTSLSLTKKDPRTKETLEEKDLQAQLDFVSADFIWKCSEKDDQSEFEALLALSNGALLIEVVLHLQNPPKIGDGLDGLTVLVDGPVIMDLLGFSGPQAKEYGEQLVSEMRSAGSRLATYQHYLEEISELCNAALNSVNQGYPPQKSADFEIRRNQNLAGVARAIVADATFATAQLGFDVIDAKKIRYGKENITDEQIIALRSSIGFYERVTARDRDAEAIGAVMRLRRSSMPTSIAEATHVFVTNNSRLARFSTNFLRRERLLATNVLPPCISNRYCAAMLWLMRGGAVEGLSRAQLLLNCTRAMSLRPDVVSKVRELLRNTDETQAELFEALIRDRRVCYSLMEQSLGDAKLIGPDNLNEILENLRQEVAYDVRQQAERELRETRAQGAVDLARANQIATTQQRRAEAAIAEAQVAAQESAAHRERIESYVMGEGDRARARMRRVIRVALVIALLALAGFELAAISNPFAAAAVVIVSTLVTLVAIFRLPDRLFGAIVNAAGERAESKARANFDPLSGEASEASS